MEPEKTKTNPQTLPSCVWPKNLKPKTLPSCVWPWPIPFLPSRTASLSTTDLVRGGGGVF